MNNDLEKALTIITSTNYEISNLEKFSSFYFYLNTLKKKITEIETQVRKKGSDMMFDMDLNSIGYQDYEIMVFQGRG